MRARLLLVIVGLAVGPCAPQGLANDGVCGANPPTGTCSPGRSVLVGEVANARDLGGVPLAVHGSVACGAVFRGQPLADLSGAGCASASALKLRTIIDLRADDERAARPDDTCVGAEVMPAPLPIPSDLGVAEYVALFDVDASIARVFHTMADRDAYPVYLHCTYGRDRTGVVAAAVLLALRASRADVLADYSLSADALGQAFPESLAGLLDEIEARGGIDAALATKGVTAADLDALRSQLTVR
jgi:hypothetical protein